MHKNAMKCNETLSKWCKNKHGASKIIDTLETYQLSLGMLMHEKFMHELFSLLMHIPTYLDVIIMFCINLWGFSIDPPYFGYNSTEQEISVFYILSF
jgi:hypothetical protein